MRTTRSLIPLLLLAGLGCQADKTGRTAPDTAPDTTPDSDPACTETPEVFAEFVWTPALSQECTLCHTAAGAASASGFVLALPDSSEDWLEQNMQAAAAEATTLIDGQPQLLLKPLGLHPDGHGGGTVIHEGDAVWQALSDYAARANGWTDDCTPTADLSDCAADEAGQRRLRRLTHAEYLATITDLLGEDVVATADLGDLAADDVVEGFSNNAGALDVSTLLADQYRTRAEGLAAAADLDRLLSCDAASEGLSNCAYRFIRDVGLRVFRRPLELDEIERYYALWYTVAEVDGDHEEGLRWVLTALLQSPHFLYRAELGARDGGTFRLSDFEIASELSYLLWGTMPDDTLLALAAEGALQDPEARLMQVERLLADDRARSRLVSFVEEWLGLEALLRVTRDSETYPELTDTIREQMRGETARLVQEVAVSGGDLAALLQADHSFLTDELAAFYGVPPGTGAADAEGFRRVDLAGTRYGGLLRQGSVLTTFALPTSSSPIHRGLLVRERLLCDDLPDPPANLDTSPPAVDPELSTRERYAQHSSDPACSGCHDQIDPIGFGFEHFDGVGRYRELDGEHPVDASGEIIESVQTDGAFYGVEELSTMLADSPEVGACYTHLWLTWSLGVSTDESDEITCLTGWLARDGQSPSLTGLVSAMVETRTFTERRGSTAEGDAPLGEVDQALPYVDPATDLQLPVPGIETETNTIATWSTGYCDEITIYNAGAEPVTWAIEVDISGTITSHWSAERDGDSGRVTFTGVSWNATLASLASTTIGYCAER